MKKRVLITGGNKGIGLELSREFLTLGYSIVVVARDFKDFELKDKLTCIEFDLSKVEDIDKLVKQIGKIDILDMFSYVAVENNIARQALNILSDGKIKGRKYRVRKLS
jgi:NAD(P)-dependent dehydrogenase (short-subunit alcohol dehydrogenase family)